MSEFVLKGPMVVNEGRIIFEDIHIKNGRIEKINAAINTPPSAKEINCTGLTLFPGVIDDQVHFRDPGLTYKGDLITESRAAVAGGITSIMEMPNTVPPVLTQELLTEKYKIAGQRSLANYSFYMGVSNENREEVLKTDPRSVCGIKIFMGSSTGNMLVDDHAVLEHLFAESPALIAVHCEDEKIIKENLAAAIAEYGEDIPPEMHPIIRNEAACYASSSYAVHLARQKGTRLHVLHISTAKELGLFDPTVSLVDKKITSEVCIHHLHFNSTDYARLGNRIKWNPAVKTEKDQRALLEGLTTDRLDVIATDHAPHLLSEKALPYLKAPSGGPMVQHALVAMLEFYHEGKITLERIAEKMAHSVAICFNIVDRGYVREGYRADLVLTNLQAPWTVHQENILYKCGWSPFENKIFTSRVTHTFVNGHLVYENGSIDGSMTGERLAFNVK